MKRKLFINEIFRYKDILAELKEENYEWDSISEYDSVYQDILDYEDDRFEDWYAKDFIQFIKYLEKLTNVKSTILK